VGDAGLTMDPITVGGIANALRDAELLADAVHEGLSGSNALDVATEPFEARRNASSLPLYAFTTEMAKLDPPPRDIVELFLALRGNPDDMRAYFGVFAQSVPVETFFAPDNIARMLGRSPSPVG
jgi:2-polyprenyl-6-methoxyphenol hydroxylase-like FAD-dependent oxidoreductase